MNNTINWEEYSNSEIEIKLKELESEYNKTKLDINNLYTLLNNLNTNYLNGVQILNKRTKNFNYK